MKISLAALGLGALGIGLGFVSPSLEQAGWLALFASVGFGLTGMLNAVVARGMSTGARVAAFTVAAVMPALALLFVIAFAIAAHNGGLE